MGRNLCWTKKGHIEMFFDGYSAKTFTVVAFNSEGKRMITSTGPITSCVETMRVHTERGHSVMLFEANDPITKGMSWNIEDYRKKDGKSYTDVLNEFKK